MAKYLDATGLSYFWEKIKTWVTNTIHDGVETLGVGKLTGGAYWFFGTDSIQMRGIGERGTQQNLALIKKDGITLSSSSNDYVLLGGGGTRQLGAAGGIPTLDSNGKIPLSQLGNLDTTVAEVVTALPESNIKKHIYLVRASSTKTNNIYKEYLYTGDTSATYDASKWEQLGEFKTDIDLTPYAKAADLTSHTGNKSNPHQVTKAQVGLGNVDNTSDANKPVSAAQQTALNGKVDKVAGKGLSTNDYTNDEKTKVTKILGIITGSEALTEEDNIEFQDTQEENPNERNFSSISLNGLTIGKHGTDAFDVTYCDSGIVLGNGGTNQKFLLFPTPQSNSATLLTTEDVGAIPTSVINALS